MNLPPVYTSIEDIRRAMARARRAKRNAGLVPTMGALHQGHARLMETAASECDFVVASIFVNPSQFGPNEDFDRYPRTLEADRELCARSGVTAIFAPSRELMYPQGFRTYVEVEGWQDVLCGATRPGHFRGVATIVLKLFNIVAADIAFFGQKDAQQVLIIRRMVRDLDLPIEIRTVPTVREPDGLALSSRNRYLSAAERSQAPALFRALQEAQRLIEQGERDAASVEQAVRDQLANVPGLRLDYVKAVSAGTLERPQRLAGPTLIALAAFLGTTRLIDNIQLDVPPASP